MYGSPYAASTYASGEQTMGPLWKFIPPLVQDVPTYLPDSKPINVRLWRHYAPRFRGVNVFVLSDDTVDQDTPTPNNMNAGYPLPWILNDPLNEYSTVYNMDGTVTHTFLDPHIAYLYEGSHEHIINQAEATFLSEAGYADFITPL